MLILGISAYYHDSAAALVEDGEVVAAAQEERFSRRRHDAAFPDGAIRSCLEIAGARAADVDLVTFYDKPFLKLERVLETYLAFAPRGFESFRQTMPLWLKERLFQKKMLVGELDKLDERVDWERRLLFSEHHLSHAASAFYPSPFTRAAVLAVDGAGEWATTSLSLGDGNDLNVVRELHFPHSLGLLYAAFAHYLGFKPHSGERRLAELAPYGQPRFARLMREHIVDVKDDGTFRVNLRYFDYCTGMAVTNDHFHELFGAPPRAAGTRLTQRELDIAASVQTVTEDIMCLLAQSIARDTGEKNLCLAGGVALNSGVNGKLLKKGAFEHLWLQPAAGDAGGALGAALAAYYLFLRQARPVDNAADAMRGSYLGPAFSQLDIEARLRGAGARFRTLDDAALISACSSSLAQGEALGWFQGRMEFGEEGLGARSILGDARSQALQDALGTKLGKAESDTDTDTRLPLSPSVLSEEAQAWFKLKVESPYMLLAAEVAEAHRISLGDVTDGRPPGPQVPRSSIPAVTHVDYSARVQTVHRETNPRYHALLSRFRQLTGCPMVANAGFKMPGQPLVCTPEEAYRAFMDMQLESLAVGNCFLKRSEQGETRIAS